MRNPFTSESRRAKNFAQIEAINMNLKFAGSEHLLYGISRVDYFPTKEILKANGLSSRILKNAIKKIEYKSEDYFEGLKSERTTNFDWENMWIKLLSTNLSHEEIERRVAAMPDTSVKMTENASKILRQSECFSLIYPIHILYYIVTVKGTKARKILIEKDVDLEKLERSLKKHRNFGKPNVGKRRKKHNL